MQILNYIFESLADINDNFTTQSRINRQQSRINGIIVLNLALLAALGYQSKKRISLLKRDIEELKYAKGE